MQHVAPCCTSFTKLRSSFRSLAFSVAAFSKEAACCFCCVASTAWAGCIRTHKTPRHGSQTQTLSSRRVVRVVRLAVRPTRDRSAVCGCRRCLESVAGKGEPAKSKGEQQIARIKQVKALNARAMQAKVLPYQRLVELVLFLSIFEPVAAGCERCEDMSCRLTGC